MPQVSLLVAVLCETSGRPVSVADQRLSLPESRVGVADRCIPKMDSASISACNDFNACTLETGIGFAATGTADVSVNTAVGASRLCTEGRFRLQAGLAEHAKTGEWPRSLPAEGRLAVAPGSCELGGNAHFIRAIVNATHKSNLNY